MLIDEPHYLAQVRATLGRDTRVVSSNDALDLRLKPADERSRSGTDTEQLFAAAYAACFLQMMKFISRQEDMELPTDAEVEARVGVGPTERGFGMEVELRISLPGISRTVADWLVEKSHAICPYSNAVRDNVSVRLVLV